MYVPSILLTIYLLRDMSIAMASVCGICYIFYSNYMIVYTAMGCYYYLSLYILY